MTTGFRIPSIKIGDIDTPVFPGLKEITAKNGFSLSYKGKTLLSRIDPVNQAERLVDALTPKERTLYLCPSPLYGYGIDALLDKIGGDSAVLCVEADAALFSLSSFHMKEQFIRGKGALRLVKAEAGSGSALCAFVNETWGKRRFRRVEPLRLNGGWQLFPDLYENLVSDLRRSMALTWGNALTLIRLGRLYSRNLIKNLPMLLKNNTILNLDYGNKPALVLGAGPSLDGILQGLELHFGKTLKDPEERPFSIICADTCIIPLCDRNIRPDLAVILESQHWNLRDFTGTAGRKIPAAVDMSALPASTRVLGSRNYLFATPWTELGLLNRLEQEGFLPPFLPPLGSVGLSAMEIALRSTKGPVVSGGIDFSCSVDAYHARSTPGQKARLIALNRLKTPLSAHEAFREGTYSLSSKQGSPVRSDPAMRNYRNLFEEEFGHRERVFEIRSPGLDLGCGVLSIEETADILSQVDHRTVAENPPPSDEREAQFEKLHNFIREEKKRLVIIKEALTGGGGREALESAVDRADYLWAHFPECAGAGGKRPPVSDISFLKRVRAEIDPFIKLWDCALNEIAAPDGD